MSEFFRTQMGRTFYEHHVPRLIKALERIATALEKSKENVGIWECDECGHRIELNYDDAISIGIPYCSSCQDKGRQREMNLLTMK